MQQDYSIWNYVWNHTIDYMWLSARVAEGSGTSDLSLPLHDDSIAELIKLAITSNSANKSFTRLHNPILLKIKLFKLDKQLHRIQNPNTRQTAFLFYVAKLFLRLLSRRYGYQYALLSHSPLATIFLDKYISYACRAHIHACWVSKSYCSSWLLLGR
jgi:hypothetical protein